MTDTGDRTHRFARSWAATFAKTLAVLLALVIGFVAFLNLVILPIHIGMWVELGYTPFEGWSDPVSLGFIWWLAQGLYLLVLSAAVIAAVIALGEVDD